MPIGLLQKRKKQVQIKTTIDSDIENSSNGNKGGQHKKAEDGSFENGNIEQASGSRFQNNASWKLVFKKLIKTNNLLHPVKN